MLHRQAAHRNHIRIAAQHLLKVGFQPDQSRQRPFGTEINEEVAIAVCTVFATDSRIASRTTKPSSI